MAGDFVQRIHAVNDDEHLVFVESQFGCLNEIELVVHHDGADDE